MVRLKVDVFTENHRAVSRKTFDSNFIRTYTYVLTI